MCRIYSPTTGSSRFNFDNARKYELGYPSYPSLYAMDAAIELILKTDVSKIEEHILALGKILINRLQNLGYTVMTPFESEKRAGNISVLYTRGEELAIYLKQQRVYLWGGGGRFRISIHAFNDGEDIEKLMSVLPKN